jgi:nicotinamide riboside kinase
MDMEMASMFELDATSNSKPDNLMGNLYREIKVKAKKITREKHELKLLLKKTQELDDKLRTQAEKIRAKYQESRNKRKLEKKDFQAVKVSEKDTTETCYQRNQGFIYPS